MTTCQSLLSLLYLARNGKRSPSGMTRTNTAKFFQVAGRKRSSGFQPAQAVLGGGSMRKRKILYFASREQAGVHPTAKAFWVRSRSSDCAHFCAYHQTIPSNMECAALSGNPFWTSHSDSQ